MPSPPADLASVIGLLDSEDRGLGNPICTPPHKAGGCQGAPSRPGSRGRRVSSAHLRDTSSSRASPAASRLTRPDGESTSRQREEDRWTNSAARKSGQESTKTNTFLRRAQ